MGERRATYVNSSSDYQQAAGTCGQPGDRCSISSGVYQLGTTWLGIKIAVESVPPLTAAGLRFLIAFPLFLLFARLRHETIFSRGDSWPSSSS